MDSHNLQSSPVTNVHLPKVLKHIVNLVGEQLGSFLQSLSHGRSVATLSLFYRYFHGECSTSLFNSVPRVKLFERETWLSACSSQYTLAVPRCRTKGHAHSSFPHSVSVWNSLPGACFPSSNDLSCIKGNFNSYLLGPTSLILCLFVAAYLQWL